MASRINLGQIIRQNLIFTKTTIGPTTTATTINEDDDDDDDCGGGGGDGDGDGGGDFGGDDDDFQPRGRRYSVLSQSRVELEKVLNSVVELMSVKYRPDNLDKYQHAIYELFNAEIEVYRNICKLIYIYQRPMLVYRLISGQESEIIFSDLSRLADTHLRLIKSLANLQDRNGSFGCPAMAMLEFTESLYCYEVYCMNLIRSRTILERKMRKNKEFASFLQSEQIRRYGQKLDLASHLDHPRRHLMKYPLLLAEIRRRTTDQNEIEQLNRLNEKITDFIGQLDDQLAETKFNELLEKLEFQPNKSISTSLASSTKMLVHQIRSNCSRLILVSQVQSSIHKWPKHYLILLDRLLILTKSSTLGNKLRVIVGIETGSDLNYTFGQIQPKQLKNFNTKPSNTAAANQHCRWMCLYSPVTNKFRINIKFKHAEDRFVWLKQLHHYFNLIAK